MSTEFFLSGSTRYLTDPNMVRSGVEEGDRWPPAARATTDWRSLLGVVLHDELLLDRDVDLCPDRQLVDEDAHPRGDGLEPRGDDPLAVGLTRHDERGRLEGLLPHVDDIVRGHLEGRDVHLAAVDDEVAVHDQLPGVAAGPREAGAVDDVVEAALQQLEDVVTGLAGA